MLVSKRCKVCGHVYSLTAFLELPLPAGGHGTAHGLIWRNCDQAGPLSGSCNATLVIAEEEVPTIIAETTEAA